MKKNCHTFCTFLVLYLTLSKRPITQKKDTMQENGGLLDTLTGKESLKVEHIVTVPVATILYIVAGVTAAAALKKVFA